MSKKMSKKISELPVADNIDGAIIPIVQDSATKQISADKFGGGVIEQLPVTFVSKQSAGEGIETAMYMLDSFGNEVYAFLLNSRDGVYILSPFFNNYPAGYSEVTVDMKDEFGEYTYVIKYDDGAIFITYETVYCDGETVLSKVYKLKGANQ